MHGCVLSQAAELFFLWDQVLFKEVAVTCWLPSPLVSPRYSLLHEVTSTTQQKEGACLREGMPEVLKDLPADAGPVIILLKTYRYPNRQCQAAVFGRAAAAAAARCCLWHTARASAVESTDTTRTRGWISLRPGPMTRLSCRDSGNRELPLRLRTWKTSWRWTALPWRSVCPIRQAWSTGKREAELGTGLDTPKTWTERLRTSRWEQDFSGGRPGIQALLNRCVQSNCKDKTSVRINGLSRRNEHQLYPFFSVNFSAAFPLSSDQIVQRYWGSGFILIIWVNEGQAAP